MTVTSIALHMPSLGGATEWLNSEPLGPAEPTLLCAFARGRARPGRFVRSMISPEQWDAPDRNRTKGTR